MLLFIYVRESFLDMTTDFDDNIWTKKDVFTGERRRIEFLNFDEDSLAIVCCCLRTGQDLSRTYSTIYDLGKNNEKKKVAITAEDFEQAEKIRNYFKKRFTLRRLKNHHVSKWMTKAEAVIETPKTIREDHIGLLVKLPEFYKENKEREAIFEQHKSMPAPSLFSKPALTNLNSVVHFAGSVERKSKTEKHVTFYFSTEENYLVAVDVQRSDMGYGLWKWLSSRDKSFVLKSESVPICHHPGYDFYQMKLNPDYEIKEI